MTSVTIGGLSPDRVVDVEAVSSAGTELGTATITAGDTQNNRSFQPGEDIQIDFGNGVSWEGAVTGQPTSSDGTVKITGHGNLLSFKHGQIYRVFYETESSEAVRSLVTEQTQQLAETLVHTGDDPANWTSSAPVAERYAGQRAGLYDYGTDLLFLGAREGYSGELRTTYESVPSDAIEDGFFDLNTRLITTDLAGIWSLVIELKTPGGDSYRWSPDIRQGAHTYQLKADEATNEDSGLDAGEMRYRLIAQGITAQPAGLFIDHAATIPFTTQSRTDPVTIDTIESSGREITRRFDSAIGRAVDELATEDDAGWKYDEDGFSYLPGDEIQSSSALSIERGTTPIVSVSADRDYESVRNEVVVQGGGTIEEVVRDQASIDYYGPLPRPEAIVDPSIQSAEEAIDRGEGFLDERAWNDAEITYTLGDLAYANISADTQLPVTDAEEGLDGTYTVGSVTVSSNGTVSITVIASSGRA